MDKEHLLKQIDHMLEVLQLEINQVDTSLGELTTIRSKLSDHKWELRKQVAECTNDEKLCIKCPKAGPIINQSYNGKVRKTWHPKYDEELKSERIEGCIEWNKKIMTSACGCGGEIWCDCGYYNEYCAQPADVCPLCSRSMYNNRSLMSIDMSKAFMNLNDITT